MEQQGEECVEPLQVLVRYFCGTSQECNMKSAKMGKFGALNNWDKVAKAAELAKKKIITEYYSIGLMGKQNVPLEFILLELYITDFIYFLIFF